MNLNPAAGSVVVLWYLLASVLNFGILATLVIALIRLNTKLDELTAKTEPLLARTETLLVRADERVTSIGNATEGLLQHSETIATIVQDRVESSSALVHRAVYSPFVGVNAALAGVASGLSTFVRLQGQKKRNMPIGVSVDPSRKENQDGEQQK